MLILPPGDIHDIRMKYVSPYQCDDTEWAMVRVRMMTDDDAVPCPGLPPSFLAVDQEEPGPE